jgi:hypothetical protein
VPNEEIIKGFKDELENVALESTRTTDINEFVPRDLIRGTSSGPITFGRTARPDTTFLR